MRSDADERADTDARADADVPLCRNRLRLARFKMLILYEGRGFGRPRGAFPDEPSCFDCMRQLVDMAIDLGHCDSSAFRRIATKKNEVAVTNVRREANTGHLFQHDLSGETHVV